MTFRYMFKTSSSDVTQILSAWNNKSRKQNLPVWRYSLCVLMYLRHSAGQFIANSACSSWRSVRHERLVPNRPLLSVFPTFEMHIATGLHASVSSLYHILIIFLLWLQNVLHKQLERRDKLFWLVVSEISVCHSVGSITESQASKPREKACIGRFCPLLFWFSPQHMDRATNRQGGVSVLG